MTLKELADRVAANLGKQYDFAFKELIKSMAITARATLIRREYSKIGDYPDYAINEIGCISVKEVDEGECCPVKIKCKVLRTEKKLPDLIAVKDRNVNYKYVGSNTRHTPYNYITPEEIPYFKESRFSANEPRYTVINKYIYLFNVAAKVIKVRGPFANPLDLKSWEGCDGTGSCFNEDESIFIEDHLVDIMIPIIYNELKSGIANIDTEVRINGEE